MNTNTIRTCVIYARLSVTKEESVSIERQLMSCRRYAQARGWKIIGEFVDDGVSATANRPEERKGWASLLAAPSFDAVIIWKVDRLARRVLDFLHADQTLQSRQAGLVAVEDPIDMTSPQGRAFAVMLAVFGEMEAEAIRARVRAARAQILAQGRWPGGGIPYGYQSSPNPDGPGRILVKDPDRIVWLEEIACMALEGATVNRITRWLTDVGAPVPGQRATVPSTDAAYGAPGSTTASLELPSTYSWHRQTVDQLLRNPILAGMRPCNPGRARSGSGPVDPFAVVRDAAGNPVIDSTLAVITVQEFTTLQRLLAARDTPQAKPATKRNHTSPFLSRVVACAYCSVFLCRGTNTQRPVLTCPRCRQTIGRMFLDSYLIERLLDERGDQPLDGVTLQDRWKAVGTDPVARRAILLTQIHSLSIQRGVVGRRRDPDRVLLVWRPDGRLSAGVPSNFVLDKAHS